MTPTISLSRTRRNDLSGVRAIVTDAETRLGLYVIRALGRAGCRVTALSRKRAGTPIGFVSGYAAERHRLPEGRYWDTLPETIEELAPEHDLLMPISTFSIAVVATREARLRRTIPFYLPSLEAFRLASDKAATARIGRETGIPVPDTHHGMEPATIARWIEKRREKLPLVIKFADDERSGAWDPGERYRIVRTPTEFATEYRRMHELGEYPLVQEYVEGEGYGFFTIMDVAGDPVATFCHRRLREYPTTGGPSTLCESFHDETLVELGTRLLRAMDWRGVAMVEFKRDRRSGAYKLLEVNPRFWGSLPLALHCGVDFPVYQAQLALGRTPEPTRDYPTGRKMRFFFPDLLAVRELWRSGDDRRGLARRYLKELFDLSIKDGLFDRDDPRPVLTYLRQNLRA